MNRLHVRTGVLTIAILALSAVTATGQDAPDEFSFAFTSAKAKTSAGVSIEGEFPRQRVIDQIVVNFPSGTKFDTAAVTRCTATDRRSRTTSRASSGACPAASKVGTGKGTAFLGDGAEPLVFDLGLYNRKGGMTSTSCWRGRRPSSRRRSSSAAR